MSQTDGIVFERKIGDKGGVPGVSFPPELMKFAGLKTGDTIQMGGYTNKKGNHISIWKKEE